MDTVAQTNGSTISLGPAAKGHETQAVNGNQIDTTRPLQTQANTETGKSNTGKIFDELLGHVADHHEVGFEPFGAVPLPYLFWDQDGFHTFGSEKSVEESQTYTVDAHGKPLRRDGKPLSFDMSVTSNVVFELVAAIILFLVARTAAKRAKTSLVPKGILNLLEVLVVFVRDEIVNPNVAEPWAGKLMPFFLSVFFFILIMNLVGLVPFGHTATGALSVTAALALCTFFVTQVVGIRAMGLGNYLKHLTGGLLDMEIPIMIKIVLIVIMVPIEIMGLFTKPFALAIRLFANMTAGHIVIVSLIGLAFVFHHWAVGAFVSVPFALFINLLELLVAALQAYVFTMLSAVFIGFMAHSEHEEHAEDHDHHRVPNGDQLVATSHTV